jgi:ribosomal protein L22
MAGKKRSDAEEPQAKDEQAPDEAAPEQGEAQAEAEAEAKAETEAQEPAKKPRRARAKRAAGEQVVAEAATGEQEGEAEAADEAAKEQPKPARRRRSRARVTAVADEQAAEADAESDADAESESDAEDEAEPQAEEQSGEAEADDEEPYDEDAEDLGAYPYERSVRVVRAQARYVRSSARKARLVCDHLRGKSVDEARAILAFNPRGVARDWSKVLESAVANAENNHELVAEDLVVREAFADEGPTIKRFQPRARGRAAPIRKRTSHLTITLAPDWR